jgi:hypothetical protein
VLKPPNKALKNYIRKDSKEQKLSDKDLSK